MMLTIEKGKRGVSNLLSFSGQTELFSDAKVQIKLESNKFFKVINNGYKQLDEW